MGKNKNRYFRKIVVNHKHYKWRISHYNCDGDGGSRYEIWNENKNLIFATLIHKEIITPKIVSGQILLIENEK